MCAFSIASIRLRKRMAGFEGAAPCFMGRSDPVSISATGAGSWSNGKFETRRETSGLWRIT
jgi:hypothetical protein